MSPGNRNHFTSSFPVWIFSFFFSPGFSFAQSGNPHFHSHPLICTVPRARGARLPAERSSRRRVFPAGPPGARAAGGDAFRRGPRAEAASAAAAREAGARPEPVAAPGPGRLLPAAAATPAPAARTPPRRAQRNARREALPGPARPGAAAPEVSAAAGRASRSAAGTRNNGARRGPGPGPGPAAWDSQPASQPVPGPGPWGAGSDPGNSGAGGLGDLRFAPGPAAGCRGCVAGEGGSGARRLGPGGARSQRPGQTPWRPAIVGRTRGSRSEFRGLWGRGPEARRGWSVSPAPAPRGRETWRSGACGRSGAESRFPRSPAVSFLERPSPAGPGGAGSRSRPPRPGRPGAPGGAAPREGPRAQGAAEGGGGGLLRLEPGLRWAPAARAGAARGRLTSGCGGAATPVCEPPSPGGRRRVRAARGGRGLE